MTLRGLDAIRSADVVVAEFYTSRMLGADVADLEALVGKPVRILHREDVELHTAQLLREAQSKLVAFLVAGDALSATTHHDLKTRAEEARIPTRVIPGISIFTAAPAAAGLQIYKFGRTTTVPFPEGSYKPKSPYDVIRENGARGLHTLVLLDIQADRERFMTVPEAIAVLRDIEDRRHQGVATPDSMLVGLARVGSADERVVYAPARDLSAIDFGPPLHCLIAPGQLHFQEEAALAKCRVPAPPSRSV